jgi:hypothetical protein
MQKHPNLHPNPGGKPRYAVDDIHGYTLDSNLRQHTAERHGPQKEVGVNALWSRMVVRGSRCGMALVDVVTGVNLKDRQ